MTVVCFGELLVDMVSSVTDVPLARTPGFLKAPGGAPANVAAALARLGVPSRFVGQVGKDPFGDFLEQALVTEGVDTSCLLRTDAARTTLAFIATRTDGAKDICFYRHPGADASLKPENLPLASLAEARVLHCGSVALSQSPTREAQMALVDQARHDGLMVTFDPNWRPGLWQSEDEGRQQIAAMAGCCDIIKVALEEWEVVSGSQDLNEGVKNLLGLGPRVVLVTCGAEGAHVFTEHDHIYQPAYQVEAIDALGAGDAFMAGIIVHLVKAGSLESLARTEPLRAALDFAQAAGALTTLHRGAIPAMPTTRRVEDFLNSHPQH